MIIWADSFDHYGTSPNGGRDNMLLGAWAQFSAGNGILPVVSTEQSRTGAHSLKFQMQTGATDGPQARRVLGSAKTVAGVAFGLRPVSLPAANGYWGISFRNNSNVNIVKATLQSDGAIGFYSGSGFTYLGASDPLVLAASWNHVEIKCIFDDIVGEIECRVNGLVAFQLTDLDLGALGCSQQVFGCMPDGEASAAALVVYYDDIITWDDTGTQNNDFLGPQRVETIFAVADTAAADFLLNGAASGFECINDAAQDGDTTYLSSDTANDISEFEIDTLPPETEIIAGVYIPTLAKLEAAGTGNIQVSLVSGVDVSLGPDQVLTTAYNYYGGVHELDPATDLPWTKSGLEAALLRIEKTL